MGQKSNPLSLRLQYTNRHYDTNWFSDSFYGIVFSKDLMYQQYFRLFSKLLKIPQIRCGLRHFPKKTIAYLFYCYPKLSREWNSKFFGIFSQSRAKYIQPMAFSRHRKDTRFSKKKPYGLKSKNFNQWTLSRSISWLYQRKTSTDLFKKRGSIPLLHEKNLLYRVVFSHYFLKKNTLLLWKNQTIPYVSKMNPQKKHDLLSPDGMENGHTHTSDTRPQKNAKHKKSPEIRGNKTLSFYSCLLFYNKKRHDRRIFETRQKKSFSHGSMDHGKVFHEASQSLKPRLYDSAKVFRLQSLLFLTGLQHSSFFSEHKKELILKDVVFQSLHGLEVQNIMQKKKAFYSTRLERKKTKQKQESSMMSAESTPCLNHTTMPLFPTGAEEVFYQENTLNAQKTLVSGGGAFSTVSIPTFFALDAKYQTGVQSFFSHFFRTETQLVSFCIRNEWQHAGYLADELVYYLEKRIPFRRIKTRFLKQLAHVETIQGLRIVCSGRMGGKSKKAQRAKVESMNYGETSRHVFSSQIDFAARTAFTSFGSVGVKVWICYT